MDLLFNRHVWIVNLLVVGCCAGLLGHAASNALQAHLLGRPEARPRSVSKPAASPQIYGKEIDPIIERNVFCSSCPRILQTESTGRTEIVTGPRRTGLPIHLVAVNHILPRSGRRYATAVLRDTESRAVGAFSAGDKVKGATITGLDQTRLFLDNAGSPEFLDLLDLEASSNAPTSAPEPRARGDGLSQELARGIAKTAEHSYELRRATLDAVLGNMSLLSHSARIAPVIHEGKAAGFRLSRIQSGGPFALIGLLDGDVISSINGLELTSPEVALDAYTKLRAASHLSLGIQRNGRRVSMEYTVR